MLLRRKQSISLQVTEEASQDLILLANLSYRKILKNLECTSLVYSNPEPSKPATNLPTAAHIRCACSNPWALSNFPYFSIHASSHFRVSPRPTDSPTQKQAIWSYRPASVPPFLASKKAAHTSWMTGKPAFSGSMPKFHLTYLKTFLALTKPPFSLLILYSPLFLF